MERRISSGEQVAMGIAERIERILRAEWNDRFRREAPVGEPGLALREGEREVLHARELVAGLSRERQDALDEARRCEVAAASALRAHDDERARTWLRLMREAEQRAKSAGERIDREFRRAEPLERAVRELGERMAGSHVRPPGLEFHAAADAMDETFRRVEARVAAGEASVMLGDSGGAGSSTEDRFRVLETNEHVRRLRAQAGAAPVAAGVAGTDDDALARLRQRMVRP